MKPLHFSATHDQFGNDLCTTCRAVRKHGYCTRSGCRMSRGGLEARREELLATIPTDNGVPITPDRACAFCGFLVCTKECDDEAVDDAEYLKNSGYDVTATAGTLFGIDASPALWKGVRIPSTTAGKIATFTIPEGTKAGDKISVNGRIALAAALAPQLSVDDFDRVMDGVKTMQLSDVLDATLLDGAFSPEWRDKKLDAARKELTYSYEKTRQMRDLYYGIDPGIGTDKTVAAEVKSKLAVLTEAVQCGADKMWKEQSLESDKAYVSESALDLDSFPLTINASSGPVLVVASKYAVDGKLYMLPRGTDFIHKPQVTDIR